MRLVAMVNDGHTRVARKPGKPYPAGEDCISSPTGSTSWQPQRTDAGIVGGRVTRIGVMPAEDAYAAVRPLIPVDADNEGRRRLQAVNLLVMPEVLQAIGATKPTRPRGPHCREGAVARRQPRWPRRCRVAPWSDSCWPMEPESWVGARATRRQPTPLWLQHPEKHYWHAFLDDGKTLVRPVQPGSG